MFQLPDHAVLQLVVTSPLVRTLETACGVFGAVNPQSAVKRPSACDLTVVLASVPALFSLR